MKLVGCNKTVSIRGRLRKDQKTKLLVKRLRPGDIALIAHQDLDWVAAEALLRSGVKAILNIYSFCTGLFPPEGLHLLLEKGVHLVENIKPDLFNLVREEQMITVVNSSVFAGGRELARGTIFTSAVYRKSHQDTIRSSPAIVEDFVINTLDYAYRERGLVTGGLAIPALNTKFADRDVVVVIRGKGYREDLHSIRTYLREKKPVLVGVDGGGDALLDCGYRPDLIIGDMDSVSDRALLQSKEVVVHAYSDGRGTPGRERLERLGVPYRVFSAPGTSEDIALLLAYDSGAALIVAIGAHSSVFEFLEKGRKGMSSTFLVRLKVGDRLVDAKGVSRLYSSRSAGLLLPVVVAAGLMPLLTLAAFSPLVQHLFRLLYFRLKLP
ncbi:MAG: putative cytokinetic ring protein SteA [Bacillota bacterium]